MGPRVHALCIRDVERGQDAPAGHGQHPARSGEPPGPSGGRTGLAARPAGQSEIMTARSRTRKKAGDIPAFFMALEKFFTIFFIIFRPGSLCLPRQGHKRPHARHGFSGSRGASCPHPCMGSHLFCLSGRRCQVEQKSLGTSLFGHVGLWFYYYRVKGRTLPS